MPVFVPPLAAGRVHTFILLAALSIVACPRSFGHTNEGTFFAPSRETAHEVQARSDLDSAMISSIQCQGDDPSAARRAFFCRLQLMGTTRRTPNPQLVLYVVQFLRHIGVKPFATAQPQDWLFFAWLVGCGASAKYCRGVPGGLLIRAALVCRSQLDFVARHRGRVSAPTQPPQRWRRDQPQKRR